MNIPSGAALSASFVTSSVVFVCVLRTTAKAVSCSLPHSAPSVQRWSTARASRRSVRTMSTCDAASRAAKKAWIGLTPSPVWLSAPMSSGSTRSTSENQNAMRIRKNISPAFFIMRGRSLERRPCLMRRP